MPGRHSEQSRPVVLPMQLQLPSKSTKPRSLQVVALEYWHSCPTKPAAHTGSEQPSPVHPSLQTQLPSERTRPLPEQVVASEYAQFGPTKPSTQPVQTFSQKVTQTVSLRSVTTVHDRPALSKASGVVTEPASQEASDASPASGSSAQATVPPSQLGVQAVGAVASQPRQVSGQASGIQGVKQPGEGVADAVTGPPSSTRQTSKREERRRAENMFVPCGIKKIGEWGEEPRDDDALGAGDYSALAHSEVAPKTSW